MENKKDKRIEEYFTGFENLDLISEGPQKNKTSFSNLNLISENLNKPFEQKKYNPINYNDNSISRGTSAKITNNIDNNNNNNNNNIYNNNKVTNAIKKSKNPTNIKNKEKKGRKLPKKAIKKILIASISIILISYTADKIYTHYQTEEIKEETIIQTYESLKDIGYDTENININDILDNLSENYLKENIFELYLIIKENIEYEYRESYYNKLVKNAGLADDFNKYLIQEGYHDKIYYSSNQEEYYLVGNKTKWENAMESIKLAEKIIIETKNKGAK